MKLTKVVDVAAAAAVIVVDVCGGQNLRREKTFQLSRYYKNDIKRHAVMMTKPVKYLR